MSSGEEEEDVVLARVSKHRNTRLCKAVSNSYRPSLTEPLSFSSSTDGFKMQSFPQRFLDAQVERNFLRFYYEKYHHAIRRSLIYGVVVWVLFYFNDFFKSTQNQRKNIVLTMIVRTISFLIGIVCIAMSYHRSFRRTMCRVIITMVMTVGISQVIMGVIEGDTIDPSYSIAIVLLTSVTGTFFRLRWAHAAFCNWSLIAIFFAATIISGSYSTQREVFTTVAVQVFSNVLFSVVNHHREYSIRRGFALCDTLLHDQRYTNGILARMLPGDIIERLKAGDRVIYRKHASVSILFSNIYDFDTVAASLTALELVTVLNGLFSCFDQLTDKYDGVYKIETIGDVYMIAAGVPLPCTNHTKMLCYLALDMQSVVKSHMMRIESHQGRSEFGKNVEKHAEERTVSDSMVNVLKSRNITLHIRIGIDSGPVIGGVVGSVKHLPRFRLVGDSVNTASRMSSDKIDPPCDPGMIQMTPESYDRVKRSHEFDIADRGPCKVKGRGIMHTYVLKGLSEQSSWKMLDEPELERVLTISSNSNMDNMKGLARNFRLHSTLSGNAGVPSLHLMDWRNHRLRPNIRTGRSASSARAVVELNRLRSVQEVSREPLESAPNSVGGMGSDDSFGLAESNSPPTDKQRDSTDDRYVREHRISIPGSNADQIATRTSQAHQGVFEDVHRRPIKAMSIESLESKSEISTDIPGRTGVADSAVQSTPMTGLKQRDSLSQQAAQSNVHALHLRNFDGETVSIQRIAATEFHHSELLVLPENELSLLRESDLTFSRHPDLERAFRIHYFALMRNSNLKGILSVLLAFILLVLYALVLHHVDSARVIIALTLRGICIVIAIATAAVSVKASWWRYESMQLFTVCFLISVSVLEMFALEKLDDLRNAFGVGVVLLLNAVSTVMFGLRFVFVAAVQVVVLVAFVLFKTLEENRFPLIIFFLLAGNIMYIQSAYTGELYHRRDFVRRQKRQREQDLSARLLRAMLPARVLRELSESKPLIAHSFQDAAVLFADIVNFTMLAHRISATDLVALLNVLFASYDSLSDRMHVYKVETIGDAYLACSGVVDMDRCNHVADLVNFAVELCHVTRSFLTPDGHPIDIRVGIHVGHVVAGVVGVKNPRYHLFSSVVTEAELFEANGIPNEVICSQETVKAAGPNFLFEEIKPFEHVGATGLAHSYRRFQLSKRRVYHQNQLDVSD